jgi:DNA primase
MIKRQVYIKDCASRLQIQEDVLLKKVVELRKQYVEEQKKKKAYGEQKVVAQEELATAEDTTKTIQSLSLPTLTNLSNKERNIQNIIQLIVRYGEKPLFEYMGNVMLVGEYIIRELAKDNIEITDPLYRLLLDEYSAHCHETNWVAASYFQFHPNVALSQLAVEMLADKYQLSRMYSRQTISENVVREGTIPSDLDILPELVERFLLELKYTIVNERIDAVQELLKEAQSRGDWQLQRTILEQQPILFEIRQQLCKALGNRVII